MIGVWRAWLDVNSAPGMRTPIEEENVHLDGLTVA